DAGRVPVRAGSRSGRSAGVHETVERAVVVDELALARLGVASVLQSQGVDVIAETQSGREAASIATLEGPDLVVCGRPADLSVADVVRRLARAHPMPAVVALLAPGQEDAVAYLVALGTRGIALRSGTVDELGVVIASALKGVQMVVPALQAALAGSVSLRAVDTGPELLSAREREVLACLAQGRSNREIAATLSVT